MAEQAIKTLLSGVSALGVRVYTSVLPDRVEYPAATYQRISAERTSAFGADAGLVRAVIQVDIYSPRAAGFSAFETLGRAVRAALQRQPSGTVTDIFLDAERDDYEDDTELYRKSYDFGVWYTET